MNLVAEVKTVFDEHYLLKELGPIQTGKVMPGECIVLNQKKLKVKHVTP
jgi:hypothetical protein